MKKVSGRLVMLKPGQSVVGKGFFKDLGKGIVSVAKAAAKPALGVVKKSGIVGNTLGAVPYVGGIASQIAKSKGYGRRRARK